MTVQFGDEPVFVGEFEDIAVPYVGFAMAISLGIGAVHLSSLRWRQSSDKLSEAEDEVARLKQQLQEQVLRVDAVQFSDSKLDTVGLTPFLDPAQDPHAQAETSKAMANPVNYQNSLPPSSAPPLKTMTKAAASAMPAAQAFHGFRTPAPTAPQSPTLAASPELGQPQPLDDLMAQLKHVMLQVEKLQDQGVKANTHMV
ncbi:MAG: hypothetical protein ACFB4J_04960 [Elainellaceae cyanobacterium]